MRKLLREVVVMVPTILLGGVGQASAGSILDQSNPGPATVALSVSNGELESQTFTVGVAGDLTSVVTHVQLGFEATGDLTIEVVTTSGGLPYLPGVVPGGILASGSVPLDWTSATQVLSGLSVPVTVGEQLAIVVTSPNASSDIAWQFQPSPSYSRGEGYAFAGADTTWTDQGGSFLFSTYVSPSAVPEPSTLGLLGLGGIGAAIVLRLRRPKKRA